MYALIDGNTFYASCERVFNPALRGRPVVVLSNNDGCSVTDNGNSASDFDLSRWVVSAGYTYNLSKRTNLYGVASYMQDKLEPSAAGDKDVKPTATTVMVGLRHRF